MPQQGVDTHVSFFSARSARRAKSVCVEPAFVEGSRAMRTRTLWRRSIYDEQAA